MVHSGMHIDVALGYRIQGPCRLQSADARRVSNAEGVRRIVRKHDCALPAQYTKHSNAMEVSFRYYRVLSKALLGFTEHPVVAE